MNEQEWASAGWSDVTSEEVGKSKKVQEGPELTEQQLEGWSDIDKSITPGPGSNGEEFTNVAVPDESIVGDSGLNNVIVRSKINAASKFQEQKLIFEEAYPEGNLEIDPLTYKLIYRKEPAEDWNFLDPEKDVTTTYEDGHAITHADTLEGARDIAEFLWAGKAELLGELAAGRGASYVVRGLRAIAGVGAAKALEERAEAYFALGDPDTWSEDSYEIIKAMGWSALGSGVYSTGHGIVNLWTGGGILQLKPGAREAIAIAKKRNLPRPTVGALSISQFWTKLESQVHSTAGSFTRYLENARLRAHSYLEGMVDHTAGKYLADGSMQNAMKEHAGWIMSVASAQSKSLSEAGISLKGAIKEYDKISQKIVEKAYGAIKVAPEYDLNYVRKEIQTLLSSNKVAILKEVDTPKGFAGMGRDAPKHTVQRTKDKHKITGDFLDLTNTLQSLDPKLTTMKDLIDLRQRAYTLGMSGNGSDASFELSRKVYNILSDTLKKPKNLKPEEAILYQRAQKMADERFTILDMANVVQLSKVDETTAGKVVGGLIKTMDADSLRVLRSVTGPGFNNMKRAYLRELTNNPLTMKQQLDTADPKALKQLFTRNELKQYKALGGVYEDLYGSKMMKAFENYTSIQDLAREGIIKETPGALQKLDGFVKSNPAAKSAIRAGIFEHVAELSLKYGKEGPNKVLNTKALQSVVDDVTGTEIAKRYLNTGDKQMLKDVAHLVHFYNAATDIQASLAGGSLVSRIKGFSADSFAAMIGLMKNYGLGKLMTTKGFQYLMTGSGKKSWDSVKVHTVVRIGMQANAGIEQTTTGIEEIERRKTNVN